MKNDFFTKDIKVMILKEMQETGKTWDECAENFRLPEMFIIKRNDPDEMIEYEGEKTTLKQFQERFPNRKHVVIRCRK